MTKSNRQPTRILHIEYGIGFGGSIVSLSELVRGLRAEGAIESRVISFQSPAVLENLFEPGTVITLRPLLSYRSRSELDRRLQRGTPWSMLRTPAMKLYALVDALHDVYLATVFAWHGRAMRADIVHVNNSWETSGLLAARFLRKPCIVHFRGFAPAISPRIGRRRVKWLGNTLHACIGISEAVSSTVVASGVPAEKVRTIHNSVSLAQYQVAPGVRRAVRTTHGFADDHVVVSIFGRITPWKGQLEFLRAIVPALARFPELRIMLVGDESDTNLPAYGDDVRRLIRRPELDGRVVLTGYQNDVAAYYSASDIVVHCSRDPEPFGRVVIEAMASGKAVVAMDEGGPPEIISHGIDGLLVPPRDDDGIRNAVVQLCEDRNLRDRLGVSARTTVRERFSAPAIAREFLAVLGEAPPKAS